MVTDAYWWLINVSVFHHDNIIINIIKYITKGPISAKWVHLMYDWKKVELQNNLLIHFKQDYMQMEAHSDCPCLSALGYVLNRSRSCSMSLTFVQGQWHFQTFVFGLPCTISPIPHPRERKQQRIQRWKRRWVERARGAQQSGNKGVRW